VSKPTPERHITISANVAGEDIWIVWDLDGTTPTPEAAEEWLAHAVAATLEEVRRAWTHGKEPTEPV
jgi:hypothetical protein